MKPVRPQEAWFLSKQCLEFASKLMGRDGKPSDLGKLQVETEQMLFFQPNVSRVDSGVKLLQVCLHHIPPASWVAKEPTHLSETTQKIPNQLKVNPASPDGSRGPVVTFSSDATGCIRGCREYPWIKEYQPLKDVDIC